MDKEVNRLVIDLFFTLGPKPSALHRSFYGSEAAEDVQLPPIRVEDWVAMDLLIYHICQVPPPPPPPTRSIYPESVFMMTTGTGSFGAF